MNGVVPGKELTVMRNRGELAEGWYDPVTKRKADESTERPRSSRGSPGQLLAPPDNGGSLRVHDGHATEAESEDEAFGPSLPRVSRRGREAGPAIPSLQDLELKRGQCLYYSDATCANYSG